MVIKDVLSNFVPRKIYTMSSEFFIEDEIYGERLLISIHALACRAIRAP